MKTNISKTKILIITALVFGGLFIGNYGQYQLAAVPSMVYQKFNLTDTQFSSIMTAPMIPAIFFSIILGSLVDKFGIKLMGGISLFIATVGYILRFFANDYWSVFIAMVLSGVVCTMFSGNLSKIVASLYSMDKVGKMIGVIMAGSTASMAVAYATTALFPNLQSAFLVVAVASVVLTVIWLIYVKEKDFNGLEEAGNDSESVPVKEALIKCLKSKNIWFSGIALMFILGGSTVITNFQVAYLTSQKGFSENVAGTFGTVLMIGAILGSILIPAAMPKLKNPGIVLCILSLLVAASTIGMVQLPTIGIYIASFLNGCLRSGIIAVIMSFPIMFEEIGPKYAGTAGGVISTLELIGAVLIPTYIVIPIAGGNMTMYFYLAAGFVAAAGVFNYLVARKLKF